MDILALALLSTLPALVIAAGLSDLTTMRIPNWISGLLILGFFPAALVVGLPLQQIGIHLAVGVVALLIGMGLFAARIIGGGDAKLMAASCLWLGLTGSGLFVLWTALFGGLFSLALIFGRKTVGPIGAPAPAWFGKLMQPQGDIPYGVAIAGGVLTAFPSSLMLAAFAAS